MPLAVKDGKLVVKNGKLCSSCCDDDTAGACCFVGENGEYSCEITTESTCESRGGKWHDGQECKSDDNLDGIDCSDPGNQPAPGPDPDPPTGACCYPDGDIPAHCHDGETQVECESAGGTWHEGKWCNEDGECPPVDPPLVVSGAWCEAPYEQIDMICAYTKGEAEEEGRRLEADSTVWTGIASTGSKEAIQDGQSCSGEDKAGYPPCPDYQTFGCTGTNPGQNDPVHGDECDCGPGWWLEVWDLVPDAGWTCTEYEDESEVNLNYPFGHWHLGQTCEEVNNCLDETPIRSNPLP